MQWTGTSSLCPISMQVSVIQLFSSYRELCREQSYRHTLLLMLYHISIWGLRLFWFAVGGFLLYENLAASSQLGSQGELSLVLQCVLQGMDNHG